MDTQHVVEDGSGPMGSRQHLERALALADDSETRYHIRQAMQILEFETWA